MPRCFRSLISAAVGRSTSSALYSMPCFDRAVMIPVAVIELDEADAAFREPPRQQAIRRERSVARLRAVGVQHALRLLAHVHQTGNAGLHLERHLVLRDPRQNLRIVQRLVFERDSAH